MSPAAALDAEDPSTAPKAMCLSGGGIRSATFALGVLQGLAKRKLLDQFDYLSTVSGGGYIGSWLSAWIQRTTPATVLGALAGPEPDPVRYLRQYSNYLSPRLGLLSADTWTLAAIYIRNLLLNWMVPLPTLAAIILIPYVCVAFLRQAGGQAGAPVWVWGLLGVGFILAVFSVAQIPRGLPRVSGSSRLKSEGAFLGFHLAPLLGASVAFTTTWFYLQGESWTANVWWFAGFGAALYALGWLSGSISVRTRLPWKAWLLIVVLGGLGGFAAWWLARGPLAGWAVQAHAKAYVIWAMPTLLGLLVLENFLAAALGSWEFLKPPLGDEDREWWARAAGWILILGVVWVLFSGIVLLGPDAWNALREEARKQVAQWYVSVGGTLSGALAALIGWSSKTSAFLEKGGGKMGRLLVNLAEKLLAPVFVIWLLVRLSLGMGKWCEGWVWWWLVGLAAVLFAIGYGIGWMLSVNRFALHNMYRNRLIRAYLGASRERQPNPLTGFDKDDNLLMTDLKEVRPFHLLNLTLNLTTGEELAWQQRKAQSFTVSCLHAGYGGPGDSPGYQPAGGYTDQGGISLGTAMAVSGAAASPNMGYHSSKVLAFLMSLFNARLGAWLPNPTKADPRILQTGGPNSAFFLWREALGMAGAQSPWVYLFDGGHFDNLGLYEMVRRHARLIVVSDAGADPAYTLDDLTRAIQHVRTDMGVPIEFVTPPVLRPKSKGLSHHCALLRIRYSALRDSAKDGLLLYIKPALSGQEEIRSRDVASYSTRHEDFPQQSTGDQFFSEEQFESYRRLGEQSVEEITRDWPGQALSDLFTHVEKKYLATAPQPHAGQP